jgi:hypothetical protein
MVNKPTNINRANNHLDFGGLVDHHCLEVIVRFVDIGGLVDHHCLGVIVHSINRLYTVMVNKSTIINDANNRL